jgi:ribonuclease III
VAHALFERYPGFSEGGLTKARAQVVSRASCAAVARELGLDRRLVDGVEGEFRRDAEKLARNPRVLAAVLEAALGSLFLEHGLAPVEGAIAAAFDDRIADAITTSVDYKTDLQELLARAGRQVVYRTVGVDGPPHNRTFTSAAVVEGEQVGTGQGGTKKDAEQAAAKEALESLVRSRQ